MMKATGLAVLATLVSAVGPACADMVAPGDVRFEDMTVAGSLTGSPGDAAAGRKVMIDKKLGNCLACHAVEEMSDQLFHGNVGPALDGVADRWEPAYLRAIVVNAKQVFGEQTIMPGFYTLDVGVDVPDDLKGKTILSAEEVEDVVAYLMTLKE